MRMSSHRCKLNFHSSLSRHARAVSSPLLFRSLRGFANPQGICEIPREKTGEEAVPALQVHGIQNKTIAYARSITINPKCMAT